LFILKILNKVPRPLLIKFGYSRIGSKIVKLFKEKQTQKWYEVGYGVKMYLDITNPHTWDLVEGREYEDKVKKIFEKSINEDNTVIDVGANIGEFSLIASKKVGSRGKVISIEPLKQATKWLKKNFELNEFANYEVIEKAAGDKVGEMTLYKKSESSEMGIMDPQITEKKLLSDGTILVDTIDNIISSRNIKAVNMLKIDAEGFEYEVLCGCKEAFKEKKIKKIICEIHLSYLKKKGVNEEIIYSFLRQNGFSFEFIGTDEDRPHILAKLS